MKKLVLLFFGALLWSLPAVPAEKSARTACAEWAKQGARIAEARDEYPDGLNVVNAIHKSFMKQQITKEAYIILVAIPLQAYEDPTLTPQALGERVRKQCMKDYGEVEL